MAMFSFDFHSKMFFPSKWLWKFKEKINEMFWSLKIHYVFFSCSSHQKNNCKQTTTGRKKSVYVLWMSLFLVYKKANPFKTSPKLFKLCRNWPSLSSTSCPTEPDSESPPRQPVKPDKKNEYLISRFIGQSNKTYSFEGHNLVLSSTFATRNNGTGMTHSSARWRCQACDKRYDRLPFITLHFKIRWRGWSNFIRPKNLLNLQNLTYRVVFG